MRRYQVYPFSQTMRETFWAVWDLTTDGFVIEPNGMVAICKDKKAVRVWAKYLNDNLPYQGRQDELLANVILKGDK